MANSNSSTEEAQRGQFEVGSQCGRVKDPNTNSFLHKTALTRRRHQIGAPLMSCLLWSCLWGRALNQQNKKAPFAQASVPICNRRCPDFCAYLGGDWNIAIVPERSVMRLASYWAFFFWYSVVIRSRLLSRASISMVRVDTSSRRGISDFKLSMVCLEHLQQNTYLYFCKALNDLLLTDHSLHTPTIFPLQWYLWSSSNSLEWKGCGWDFSSSNTIPWS